MGHPTKSSGPTVVKRAASTSSASRVRPATWSAPRRCLSRTAAKGSSTCWWKAPASSASKASALGDYLRSPQAVDLVGGDTKGREQLFGVLAKRRRRQVAVGSLAVNPYRRAHERNAGHRADHLPGLSLYVGQSPRDLDDMPSRKPGLLELMQ